MFGLFDARKSGLILILMALCGALLILARPGFAQDSNAATVAFDANLRSGPDTGTSILASVPAGTVVSVSARSADSAWLLVTTPTGKRGWIMVRQVQLASSVNLAVLPVSA